VPSRERPGRAWRPSRGAAVQVSRSGFVSTKRQAAGIGADDVAAAGIREVARAFKRAAAVADTSSEDTG